MEQSGSRQADIYSITQLFSRLRWNPEVHCLAQKPFTGPCSQLTKPRYFLGPV
jgi:hypothetical protein